MGTSYDKKGFTNIGDALRYACEDMFVLGKGDRLKVKDYLILLTDGKSNRGNIMTGVTKCTSRNVSIIGVGIGDGIDEQELRSIVSKPEYYFNTTYTELNEALPELVTTSVDCSAGMCFVNFLKRTNHISCVMVSVLASSVVDHGFKPPSGQTKGYTIGICCFSAKHAALRKKSKDWLVWNQDNVYRWVDMSIGGLLFQ